MENVSGHSKDTPIVFIVSLLGETFSSVVHDCTVRVWNSEGECVAQWDTGSAAYAVIEWNGLLCTGHSDSSIKIWNDFNKHIQKLNVT